MYCPFCGHEETKVIDSRLAGEGRQVRRRRQCLDCNERFTTFETAELVMINVLEDCAGQGVGRTLMETAEEHWRTIGAPAAVLWVLADNEPARRFYANAGGREVAEGRENFDGKDLLKIAYAWD